MKTFVRLCHNKQKKLFTWQSKFEEQVQVAVSRAQNKGGPTTRFNIQG
jgi:hypothetical protein